MLHHDALVQARAALRSLDPDGSALRSVERALTPDARLKIRCPPGLGAANVRYRAKSNKALSDAYKSFRDFVWHGWHYAGRPVFDRTRVEVEVRHWWIESRTVECRDAPPAEVPAGDVDCLGKSVLDALEKCGAFGKPPVKKKYRQAGEIYGDDARVVGLVEHHFVTGEPEGWVEVDLWEVQR